MHSPYFIYRAHRLGNTLKIIRFEKNRMDNNSFYPLIGSTKYNTKICLRIKLYVQKSPSKKVALDNKDSLSPNNSILKEQSRQHFV
jgi:hypothetical protein